MDIDLEDHFSRIYLNVRKDRFRGYDPYDGLNTRLKFLLPGKWTKIAFTQFNVYSPVQLRPFLLVPKGINPKGMGLLLSALTRLKRIGVEPKGIDLDPEIRFVYDWIVHNMNKDYSGPCWGYHFPWQDLNKYIPRFQPSSVVTSFIGDALCDHHLLMGDDRSEKIIRGIASFMMNDLNQYEDEDGICFSYSPFDSNVVHNANVLTARFLLRAGTLFDNIKLVETAKSCFSFSINKQNQDGSWYYSWDPKTSKGREQYDFHQGYMLDSIMDSMNIIGDSSQISLTIKKGADFYRKLFLSNGASFFRYPRKWPVDIHNQTQGIITFRKLEKYGFADRSEWENIFQWTLKNMISKDHYIYNHIWPMVKGRNKYFRWSYAWMLKAISNIL